MEKTIASYNPADCTVVINNSTYITGLGEDMVSFSKDEDFFEPAVGAQGDVVVNESVNDLYTLSLSVQATSPQKEFLMNLARSREFFSVVVSNKNIGESFGGTRVRMKKFPELSHGATAEDRVFEMTVFDGYVK